MADRSREPTIRVFDVLQGEATAHRSTRFGDVGTVFTGSGIECAWVSKHHEQVDPDWFSSEEVDLMIVVQGALRVEFDSPDEPAQVLSTGHVLVLPPKTRCRASSWPRDRGDAAVFVAVYPVRGSASD